MSPSGHPDPCRLSEGPASLVGWFGVNRKEGYRKERITLNKGEPSELQRTLVPLSLYSPSNEAGFGFLCPPPVSEAAIVICKSSRGSDPFHEQACDLQVSIIMKHGDTIWHGDTALWTGIRACLPLGVVAHKTWLRVHPHYL